MLSLKALIETRNFGNLGSTISLEQLAKHCGHRRPISLMNLITGSCAEESTLPPLGKDPGSQLHLGGIIHYLPDYIKLTLTDQLDVSFLNGAFEKIIIPTLWFPNVITDPDSGDQYFPDNFCGFKIIGAASYQWSDHDGRILEGDFLKNDSVPDDQHLVFTGPIGKCSNGSTDFFFAEPLLYGGGVLPHGERHYVLQIQGAHSIELMQNPYKDAKYKEFYSIDIQKILKKFIKTNPEFFEKKLAAKTLYKEGYDIQIIADRLDLDVNKVFEYIQQPW
ncbi:MAG TPA: hypothetical protein PLZ12_14535 [Saprospiraceae bacterium]|nr:hypothetical protein [Saprospiraceae bacterium]